MVETDRRRIRGEQARAGVLAHSARIASMEGLEGLTFGRLATEAGVAKGNIQVLFGDKEALQLATLESVVDLYRAAVVAPAMVPRARPSWAARWSRAGSSSCRAAARREAVFTAASSEYRTRPGAIRDRVNQHRTKRARFETPRAKPSPRKNCPRLPTRPGSPSICWAYQAIANVAAAMGDEARSSPWARTLAGNRRREMRVARPRGRARIAHQS